MSNFVCPMRSIYRLLAIAFTLFIASAAVATTVQVGGCLPSLQSFATISQAVGTVPAGSTVLVCPGTYPEQVVMSQALTLRGVQVGNSANPTITVPTGGLRQSVMLGNGVKVFYQLLAHATPADEINISNIAINGSKNQVGSKGWLSGICYLSSSGTLSRVATFNQKGNGEGWGILLESDGTASTSNVSITQSSIHDFDNGGIRGDADTFTVNITNNSVTINKSPTLYTSAAAMSIVGTGVISGNSLLGPSSGVAIGFFSGVGIEFLSNLTVSANTIEGLGIGIWALGNSNTIKSNRVSESEGGIVVSGNNNDVEYNSFTNLEDGTAISFNATGTSNTVTHNTINDAEFGIATDPGGNTLTPNSFTNVTTIVQGAH